MAPRIPIRARLAVTALGTAVIPALPRTTVTSTPGPFLLLPRTTRRSVQYGWHTAPPQNRKDETVYRPLTEGLPPLTTGPDAALARKAATTPVRTGVLAIKKGMSSVFRGRKRLPCTVLQMDRVEVVAQRTRSRDGYWALQVGLGARTPANVGSAQLGYYEARGMAPKAHVAEFRVRAEEGLLPVGVQILPDWFKKSQYVDVKSTSRGMGFAGVMKRHGFSGQEASHGNSLNHRTMGSAGGSQGSGSRVHPGKRMAGRMGGISTTVQNLKVLDVDNDTGIIVVKGSVGGPKGCVVRIQDSCKRLSSDAGLGISQKSIEWKTAETLARNEGVTERVKAARKLHLTLKTQRKRATGDRAVERKRAIQKGYDEYSYTA